MASDTLPKLHMDAPQMGNAVGRLMISKLFNINGKLTPFQGTVVKYDKRAKYYLVVYEDSDREEMDWEELMRHAPTWILDDTATPAAGPPAKLRKKAETEDVSAAAAAAAAAEAVPAPPPQQQAPSKPKLGAASKAALAQKLQQLQPKQRRDPAAAPKAAEGAPAPASKGQHTAQAAAAAAAAAAGVAPKRAGKDKVQKDSKPPKAGTAPGTAKAQADGAAAATTGGSKPSKAARAAGAPKPAGSAKLSGEGMPVVAAAAAPRPSKSKSREAAAGKAAASKDQAAAAAVAGGKKASKKSLQQASVQQQQQQQDGDVQPVTDQRADKARIVRPVKVEPLPEYGPARVCEEVWRVGTAAFIADMAGIREAAQQAAEVVTLKDGRPVFEAQPEDLPMTDKADEALRLLKKEAASWKDGNEPYRRMALPPHIMDLLLQDEAAGGIAAAAAAMAATTKMEKVKKPAGSADSAAAAAAAAGEGQQKAGPKKTGSKKLEVSAAAAAAGEGQQQAMVAQKQKGGKQHQAGAGAAGEKQQPKQKAGGAAAGEGQQQAVQKTKSSKKRQADAAPATDQQQHRGSKKLKTGAGPMAAVAAAGAADVEEQLVGVEYQHQALWIPTQDQDFADPDNKLAQAMKQLKTDYDTAYRTAQQTEEERAQRVAAEIARRAAAEKAAAAANLTKPQLKKPSRMADTAAKGKKKQAAAEKAAAAADSPKSDLKNASRRADTVAMGQMITVGQRVNDRACWGSVPGCKVNCRFELRAQSSLAGVQKSNMSGMVAAPLPYPVVINGQVYPNLKAVTSLVGSGIYMANKDGHTHDAEVKVHLKYTGQGGCDLLGGKQQVRDQELKDANRHMLVNWALGIPVRYLRRNDDADSTTGTSLVYDGLYYVTSCCRQYVTVPPSAKHTGGTFLTFVYGLKRLPGQAASLSAPISHWKAAGSAKVQPSIDRRPHAVCRDISKGVEAAGEAGQQGKASTCVVASNEVDRMLPPGIHPEKDKVLLLPPPNGGPWKADPQEFKYIGKSTYAPNVPLPKPPKLLTAGTPAAKAAEANMQAAAAAGSNNGCGKFMPPTWPNAPLWNAECVIQTKQEAEDSEHGPHKLLRRLNGGYLPYTVLSRKVGKTTKQVAVAEPRILPRVLIECGEHLGCKDKDCPQRQAHRRLQYRLEVYKTLECGWGVQSWDMIYAGTLVCIMVGRIIRKKDVGPKTKYGDSAYVFDLMPRPDRDHLGKPLKPQQKQQKQQQGEGSTQGAGSSRQQQQQEEEEDSEQGAVQGSAGRSNGKAEEKTKQQQAEPRYVLCARDEGNVARFINHSCEPNLYVQPILAGHTDTDHVMIGLFACRDIPAFTPLSYDYGEQYLEEDLQGDCKCGADSCYSKLPKNQARKEAASRAPSPKAAAAAAAGDATAAAATAAGAAGSGGAGGSRKQKRGCCGDSKGPQLQQQQPL